MNDRYSDQPVDQDHAAVLHELLCVITSATAEYPELVQQKVATSGNEIGNRNRNERRRKTAKERDCAKINHGDTSAHGYKSQESKSSVSIQNAKDVHCACS